MIEEIYHDVILAGWVTCLILGICLLWCRVPIIPTFRIYLRSRRILGLAYLVFAVSIAQFTLFNLRLTHPEIAVALPLSYYYLEAILFGMSFCSLLNPHYISRRQINRDFGFYAIFLMIAWCGALLGDGILHKGLLIAASVWFFIMGSSIAIRFLKIYRKAVGRISDYYTDNVEGFVMWLHNSTYGIIILGLSGAVLAFAPMLFNAIFMFCGICLFTYIFISMQNYIMNYEVVSNVLEVEEETENTVRSDSDNRDELRKAVSNWLAADGFIEPGVTLDKLAMAVGVNRSYVSAFINSEYRCNFREFINSRRLEYAKRLMRNHPDATIDKISQDSGFSSPAYFSRLFVKKEGVSPSRWREQQ